MRAACSGRPSSASASAAYMSAARRCPGGAGGAADRTYRVQFVRAQFVRAQFVRAHVVTFKRLFDRLISNFKDKGAREGRRGGGMGRGEVARGESCARFALRGGTRSAAASAATGSSHQSAQYLKLSDSCQLSRFQPLSTTLESLRWTNCPWVPRVGTGGRRVGARARRAGGRVKPLALF
jgi:hypothetical protein